MILKNKYDEAIKYIEVTDEIRDRILANINNLTFEKASTNNKVKNKTTFFSNYRMYLSLAACTMFLIGGSFFIHNTVDIHKNTSMQVVPDIVTVQSAKDLSDTVGFTVKEIHNLPFEIKLVSYNSYWGEIAEIEYTGSNDTAIFRIGISDEDISGYSGEFTSIESHIINGCDVTIKGNNGQYILAIWQSDGYYYSVNFAEPVSEQEMMITLRSIE